MTDLSVIIPEVKGAREYTKSEMRAAVIDSTVAFMARSQGGIEHIKDLLLDADDH